MYCLDVSYTEQSFKALIYKKPIVIFKFIVYFVQFEYHK